MEAALLACGAGSPESKTRVLRRNVPCQLAGFNDVWLFYRLKNVRVQSEEVWDVGTATEGLEAGIKGEGS